ncbi:MAG: SiaB family protein kinase [Leptospiraceae bacterium]|nr:SiaB family protein kinase [Leptospiraceae bacterium]
MDDINPEIYNQYIANKQTRVIFSFKGRFSQEILTELGSMIRTSLQAETKIRKIFGVFIEISQNILYYSDEREVGPTGDEGGVGIVLFQENDTDYILGAGNILDSSRCDGIKDKIEQVNSLNKDQLKEYYQKQLRQDRPQTSKGAGVGLIDIARKSDYPLGYSFTKIDEEKSFFTMSIKFKKEG